MKNLAHTLWIMVLTALVPALTFAQTTVPPNQAAIDKNKLENATTERDKAPAEGDLAPDFTLKSIDGKSEVTLSGFRGKQPVVLIFGSYT